MLYGTGEKNLFLVSLVLPTVLKLLTVELNHKICL